MKCENDFFSEMCLETMWCGRLVFIDFDVSVATNF